MIGDEATFAFDGGDGDGKAGLTAILEPGHTATVAVSDYINVKKDGDSATLGSPAKTASLKYSIPGGLTNFPASPVALWNNVTNAAYKVSSLVGDTWQEIANGNPIPAGGAFKKLENVGSDVLKVKNVVAEALFMKSDKESLRALVPGNMDVYGGDVLSDTTINTANPYVTVFIIVD